jgi:aminopeptidase-like protein
MSTQLEQLFDKLWPINRSLTGDGNRASLKLLSETVDIEIKEVASGTQCYDWTVPAEWNIKEAWIKNGKGEKIVDFSINNLHILGYSIPYKGKVSYQELISHLYTLPQQPTLIPYRTSYYEKRWGFCLTQIAFDQLDPNDIYEVFIDSSLNENGSMTIGEAYIKGDSDEEILFSTYICHPSLAVNELSGPLVSSLIYQKIKQRPKNKYSYRFLFIPETIGSIYSLTQYGNFWKEKLVAGFVVTCVGHNAPFTYKKSRRGDSFVDRAAELVLMQDWEETQILDFFPGGSDERQYCSPGFNLPVGSLMRTMYGQYPEYHTSGDNKSLICFKTMEKTVEVYLEILQLIEANKKYVNKFPNGEPQLGKRGLYPTVSTPKKKNSQINAMMWLLNYSDGTNDLLSIIKKSNLHSSSILEALEVLTNAGILE